MAKKKTKQTPIQLELFSASHYLSVDPAIEHMRDVIEPLINEATSMHRYGMIAPETVFDRLVEPGNSTGMYQNWNLCGVDAMVTPKRLRTFKDQLSCVGCGREGNVFLVERHRNDNHTQYMNLYAISNGSMVLMTVDHILPDSMGGRYDSANFQTMCRVCNQEKKNMMSYDEVAMVRDDPKRFAKAWMPHGFLSILLDLQVMMNDSDDPVYTAHLNTIFDRYRRKVKHNTKEPAIAQLTVALRQAIVDADPYNNGVVPHQTSVAPVTAQGSTKVSWSDKVKQWFASWVTPRAQPEA